MRAVGSADVRVLWRQGEVRESSDDRRQQEQAIAYHRGLRLSGTASTILPAAMVATAVLAWFTAGRWAAAVLVVAAVVAAIGARVSQRRFESLVWDADNTVGLPVPEDLVDVVLDARMALGALDRFDVFIDRAGDDMTPEFAARLSALHRDLTRLDDICGDMRFGIRRHWVRQELHHWRFAVEELRGIRLGVDASWKDLRP